MLPFHHLNQHLYLLPDKAIYWKEEQALLIADPHIGKVTHFRKAGIAVPGQAAHENLWRLEQLIKCHDPKKIIFLGDLFHSEMNIEWLMFKELLHRYSSTRFLLVLGNHDILHHESYSGSSLEAHLSIELGPYFITHEPEEHLLLYNLSGHLHPGVRMVGKGRQSMRFPCFYFGQSNGILPAFGEFTGLHILQPKPDDEVFVITGNNVINANE